jgi:dihydrofolate reductase
MKKIIVQHMVSLDGYFEGPNREIDWHVVDGAFNAFVIETLDAADVLVMGRVNYELMASYWPTAPNDDAVKKFMNGKPKLVFSRTLKEVTWQNSRLATGSISEEVARLILAPAYLGGGNALFNGIKTRHKMKYVSMRSFDSGNVLLTYQPVRE